jgi:hypothetical protein
MEFVNRYEVWVFAAFLFGCLAFVGAKGYRRLLEIRLLKESSKYPDISTLCVYGEGLTVKSNIQSVGKSNNTAPENSSLDSIEIDSIPFIPTEYFGELNVFDLGNSNLILAKWRLYKMSDRYVIFSTLHFESIQLKIKGSKGEECPFVCMKRFYSNDTKPEVLKPSYDGDLPLSCSPLKKHSRRFTTEFRTRQDPSGHGYVILFLATKVLIDLKSMTIQFKEKTMSGSCHYGD